MGPSQDIAHGVTGSGSSHKKSHDQVLLTRRHMIRFFSQGHGVVVSDCSADSKMYIFDLGMSIDEISAAVPDTQGITGN